MGSQPTKYQEKGARSSIQPTQYLTADLASRCDSWKLKEGKGRCSAMCSVWRKSAGVVDMFRLM